MGDGPLPRGPVYSLCSVCGPEKLHSALITWVMAMLPSPALNTAPGSVLQMDTASTKFILQVARGNINFYRLPLNIVHP